MPRLREVTNHGFEPNSRGAGFSDQPSSGRPRKLDGRSFPDFFDTDYTGAGIGDQWYHGSRAGYEAFPRFVGKRGTFVFYAGFVFKKCFAEMYRSLLEIRENDVVVIPAKLDAHSTYTLVIGMYRRRHFGFYFADLGFTKRNDANAAIFDEPKYVFQINDPFRQFNDPTPKPDRVRSPYPTMFAVRFRTDDTRLYVALKYYRFTEPDTDIGLNFLFLVKDNPSYACAGADLAISLRPAKSVPASYYVRHSAMTLRGVANVGDNDCPSDATSYAASLEPTSRVVNAATGLPDGVYDNGLTVYELCAYTPLCQGFVAAGARSPAVVRLPTCALSVRRHPAALSLDATIDAHRVAVTLLRFVGRGKMTTVRGSNTAPEYLPLLRVDARLVLSVVVDGCASCAVESIFVERGTTGAVRFCAPPGVNYVVVLSAIANDAATIASILSATTSNATTTGTAAVDPFSSGVRVTQTATSCGAQASALGVQPDTNNGRLFTPQRANGDRGAWAIDVDLSAPSRRSFDGDKFAVTGSGPMTFDIRNGTLVKASRAPFATIYRSSGQVEFDSYVARDTAFVAGTVLVNCAGDRLELTGKNRRELRRRKANTCSHCVVQLGSGLFVLRNSLGQAVVDLGAQQASLLNLGMAVAYSRVRFRGEGNDQDPEMFFSLNLLL